MTPKGSHEPPGHPIVKVGRIGVLLVNLGTPDGYDTASMRRYLKEFLSDRRVIEAPKWLWWPILNGIILNTRPKKSAEAYRKIWLEEEGESPLRYYTRAQADAVSQRFTDDGILVDWAMRYGTPSIPEKLDMLLDRGCRRILVVPLYPQYSAATTASVQDKVFEHLKSCRWQPAIRTLPGFHDHPDYIEALACSVRDTIAEGDEPDMLLCSFHGMPRETLDKGDPYHCFCQKTGRLLREALDWPEDRFRVVFQSRFGPKEWLQPYADETIVELAKNGVEHVGVISPGFVSDCVETLEELSIGLRESFMDAGGKAFTYVPCLNASPGMIDLLEGLVRTELSGWVLDAAGTIGESHKV